MDAYRIKNYLTVGLLETHKGLIQLAGNQLSRVPATNLYLVYPRGAKLYVINNFQERVSQGVVQTITLPTPEVESTELCVRKKENVDEWQPSWWGDKVDMSIKYLHHWVECSRDGKYVIVIDNAYVHHILRAGSLHGVIERYARAVSIEVPSEIMNMVSSYIGVWRAGSGSAGE